MSLFNIYSCLCVDSPRPKPTPPRPPAKKLSSEKQPKDAELSE